ncbi:protein mono-ADP-ribosyltransferase PARP3-like [Panulirus ornatus]|uniref:protein mono-ADP-ribosyltransferase PARP3-like n=1 Tax=Panulirus ornatus TaxID=150431 RepID=UPI003A8478B8
MPCGGRRGKKQNNKRKANIDKSPRKVQRKDGANIHGEQAAPQDENPHSYKPDHVLLSLYPNATIYEDYACKLIQTNSHNKESKFYIIQVVKSKKNFICFTRWGSVGEEGLINFVIQKNAEGAIKVFKLTFKDKTKNEWDQREKFTPQPGKYILTAIGEDDEVDDDQFNEECAPCPLPYRTQIMIQLIYSDDMFLDTLLSLHLDLRKVSVNKVHEVHYEEGIAFLTKLEEAIASNKPQKLLLDLTSKFYSVVPITYKGICPPVIDTYRRVQLKKEIVLTLLDVKLTQKLQYDQSCTGLNTILKKFEILDSNLTLLENHSREFKVKSKLIILHSLNLSFLFGGHISTSSKRLNQLSDSIDINTSSFHYI